VPIELYILYCVCITQHNYTLECRRRRKQAFVRSKITSDYAAISPHSFVADKGVVARNGASRATDLLFRRGSRE
jgi:hypothetical protein